MKDYIEEKYGKNSMYYLSTEKNINVNYNDILTSWRMTHFRYIEEKGDQPGLRKPQIGGIHSILGALKSSERKHVTIVMPTGTGKTETILSIVIADAFERTLVIVPSDALRGQIADKFIQLGLLHKLKLINDSTLNPKVLVLRQGSKSITNINYFLEANVIVTTASAISFFNEDCINFMVDNCSHLVIDEAHHIKASTWAKIKTKFGNKPVIQFTATPYRTDGQRVDGKIIFDYPIEQAQKDGYFKEIEFYPVKEFVTESVDERIAEQAIKLLKQDISNGYDHILMARASSISKAEKIFKIYSQYQELNPILINSKVGKKKKILDSIKSLNHRIIVCVDMLGEGFDLPQLKIAALHDIHKSINITLQFTGRFTRLDKNLGNAKFIANIADPKVNEALQELYNENSDWNRIVRQIGTQKIESEKKYQEFIEKFDEVSNKLIEQGLNPNISTVVYKLTKIAHWTPQEFIKFSDKKMNITDYSIAKDKSILIFSTQSFNPVGWSHSKEISDIIWDLYIAYFDSESSLLFIHSSSKNANIKKLVDCIAKDSIQIKGEKVFRILSGLKRLYFQNLGVNKDQKKLRYIMYTGTDIQEAIPEIETRRAIKSNIFAKGYEQGKLITLGCSHKGKIWSMDNNSLDEWVKWCKKIGKNILDDSINTNEIIKTAIKTEYLEQFPNLVPLYIDWPVDILRKNETKIVIDILGETENLLDCQLVIDSIVLSNTQFSFYLQSSTTKYSFSLQLTNNSFKVISQQLYPINIIINDNKLKIEEYFESNPPTIFLSDTSLIEGNERFYSDTDYLYEYEKEKILIEDWSGVDISIESQKEDKIHNSIQYHMIQQIKDKYDLVFDDDGSGEIADIVAVKNINDEELVIDLYHCKFCPKIKGSAIPGARVSDIYEVSGQTIKSIKWIGKPDVLFDRMIKRENKRLSQGKSSRIDKGSLDLLYKFKSMSHLVKNRYQITIVQPAISKEEITKEMLSVLGAAETYLKDTTGINLQVIASN
ncbi:MAG: DEAD/DEAH box helicase family protein [Snodgrassella sp.]|uniref:DEAD/DEAH box helicase n=1 Tax=Snodgrassella sp. TaxID=2815304 RepID=UPI00258333B2|nr:DEAD/DEAH box helicase family protein [Snodgrassella sp.]MCO6523047.1 DEAD/DEAH box helicase family protein [Snodgrassella sp.]